ncbi:MAG: alanine dehydrogenase [Draconibacterium sp.]|nr:MAG: alanine dehydrogenase [Draconibacterium sp.]
MISKDKPKENSLISRTMLLPQEERLEVVKRGKKMKIGIPSDLDKVEYRMPLTPQAVDLLVSYGHEILIEKNAGKSASYSNSDYTKAGAVIVENRHQALQCDIVLRISPFSNDEIDALRGNQVVISSMQVQGFSRESIQKMMQKKITAIAFEYLENEEGFLPFVHQMSQIAGVTSITIASEYLSKSRNGKGVLFGEVTGITPAELVILGTSTAAEYAARAALGLGIFVKVFDNSVYELSKLEEKLGRRIFTSVFYPKVLRKALVSADVVIGAMSFNSSPGFKVSEELIKEMKEGAVIIDLNVSQGGCFETSVCTDFNNPTYIKHGVVHYCVPNSPAMVARTATISLSNILVSILLSIADSGGIDAHIKNSVGFRKGVYLFHGALTNADIGYWFNIPSKDIDLLLAVF